MSPVTITLRFPYDENDENRLVTHMEPATIPVIDVDELSRLAKEQFAIYEPPAA